MKPISNEAFGYLNERMPALVKQGDAGAHSRAEDGIFPPIVLSLPDFNEDPFLLYCAVWYQCSLELTVTISG